MKLKKAKSTAAVLAALVLTSGFCGMSAEAATLNSRGSIREPGSATVTPIDVYASGEDVAASLDGQDVNLHRVHTTADVVADGTVAGTYFMTQDQKFSVEDGTMKAEVVNADTITGSSADIEGDVAAGSVHSQGDIVSNATVSGEYLYTNDGKFSVIDGQVTADSANIKGNIDAAGAIHAQGDIVSNSTVSGKYLYTNDGKFSVVDGQVTADSANIKGDLNVGGNLTVNGTTITGEDLVGSVADVSTIKNKVGFDTTTNTYKDITVTDAQGNAVTNLTDAVNTVDSRVGNGVLSNTNASNLTEAVNQNYAQINNNTQAISSLGSRVSDLGDEIDNVGAISAALAGLHPLDYDGTGSKFQISAAVGTYDGSQAAALGAFYHFNRDVMLSLGGATAFDGDQKTAANLGVTFRIGEGASGKAVSDDVMARLEAMDQKIAALEQENKDLKNVLGAIDTSLSKEFPDVPANHWAYEAVTKLAGNDVVAGYPDGEFHGDRTMTRYEMAEVIYKAMQKGAKVDQKLVNEFKPEMEQVAANQNA